MLHHPNRILRPAARSLALFALATAALAAAAQPGREGVPPTSAPGTAIEPGDLIEINIFELIFPDGDYAEARRVSPSGHVRLPVLGKVEVAGLTSDEARTAVETRLRDRGIARDPQVRVALRREAKHLEESAGPLDPDDVVVVKIFELRDVGQDFVQTLVLDAEGEIEIPVLDKVQARGLDLHELEDRLIGKLREASLIVDASVRVERREDGSHARFASSP